MTFFLFPELIDHIFEYLDNSDIYACLFVNHQFNEHAVRYLYRYVRIATGFTAYYKSENHKIKKYKEQESLWENIFRRPALARHIHHLNVNPLHENQGVLIPPFSERVHFIIRHAYGLRMFEYIDIDKESSSDYSVRLLSTCIAAIECAEAKPEISMTIRHPILGEPLGDLLLYINKRFSVTGLDILLDGTQDILFRFVAQFHQLRRLALWVIKDYEIDMDRFLGHLPLRELTLYGTIKIGSFPHQIEVLNMEACNETLNNTVWAAICNLTRLSELNMEFRDVKKWLDEESFIFKSKNLKILTGDLRAETAEILRRQIIQPIYDSSHLLESVELHINTPLSFIFISLLLSKETLVNIDVRALASPYSFRELAALPKILPNLETLYLPWPNIIGIPSNDDADTAIDWACERNRTQDIPERLTFNHCQSLAAKFPKLSEIDFRIDSGLDACNKYWIWRESVEYNMPLDPAIVIDIKKSRRSQSFKMATFIDEKFPCLNVCSVFICYCTDDDDPDDYIDTSLLMTLTFSLNQIRRHARKECSHNCTLLLEDDEAVQEWNDCIAYCKA